MTAIRLANLNDSGRSLVRNERVIYYFVRDYAVDDHDAALVDSDVPAFGTTIANYGQVKSKRLAQILTPNSSIVAVGYEQGAFGEWIGKPRPVARTVILPWEIVEVPRFVKRTGTTNSWDYSPFIARRAKSLYIVTQWVPTDVLATQARIDSNVGKLVTGIRTGITYPTHQFIGARCDDDGTYTRVEYTFESQGAIIVPDLSGGIDKWDTDIIQIPSLRPFEQYAYTKPGAGTGQTPKVWVVPAESIYGPSVAVGVITG